MIFIQKVKKGWVVTEKSSVQGTITNRRIMYGRDLLKSLNIDYASKPNEPVNTQGMPCYQWLWAKHPNGSKVLSIGHTVK